MQDNTSPEKQENYSQSTINTELKPGKSRAGRCVIWAICLIVIVCITFSAGAFIGFQVPETYLPQSLRNLKLFAPASPTKETDTLFEPFWQSWNIIHDQYVDQPVNDEKLMQGAIRGMLESLGDPHTSYMDPDQYRQQSTPLEGEYEGIGAWVDITGEFVVIIAPMANSPAEKANLKSGDTVIAVDGEDMTGIDGALVLRRIMGPADSTVKLTIRRKDVEKPFDVEIQRAKIQVPSVESKIIEGKDIAYVRLYTFGEKTETELHDALKTLLEKNPKGLILDLRYNGGGYLKTAITVVSEFIEQGDVMYEEYRDGSRQTFTSTGKGLATKIPLVVLVNEGTASASEITAGAIQDYGRGKLVGIKTYGKGSVQNWIELKDNEGAVRITIARWLTPKDRQINKKGLTPDVVVELTEEDAKAKKDTQLDKAVEILSQK